MSKRVAPAETETYMYHNANPKDKQTTDCVTRALSTALKKPWESVMREVMETAIRLCYGPTAPNTSAAYLKGLGWHKAPQPRHEDNSKYTGKEFCRFLSIKYPHGELGNVIANIGSHHITCIVPTEHGDGINCRYKILDTWNCSDWCVGNYWYDSANECKN